MRKAAAVLTALALLLSCDRAAVRPEPVPPPGPEPVPEPEPNAILARGDLFNLTVKKMVDGNISSCIEDDDTVTAFRLVTDASGMPPGEYETVSDALSPHPVYARLDGTEIILYTPAPGIDFNENSAGVFRNFTALKDIDLTGFCDARVKDFTRAFARSGFEVLDLPQLSGSNMETVEYLFENSPALREVHINNFTGSSVTDFGFMFSGCRALRKVQMKSADTSSGTVFKGMFMNCVALAEADLGYYFTIGGVTDDALLNNMWGRGAAQEKCDLYCTQETYDAFVSNAGKTRIDISRTVHHPLERGVSLLGPDTLRLVRGNTSSLLFRLAPAGLRILSVELGNARNFTYSYAPAGQAGEYILTLRDSGLCAEYSEEVTMNVRCAGAAGDIGQYSASFTVMSSEVNKIDTGLPIVCVDTRDGAEINDRETWIGGSMMTIYNPDLSVSYAGDISIKGRGNNTWLHAKKPYSVKLDAKSEILGMKAHKRWCLLANYVDRTLMRNEVAFEISRRTSLAYTPSGRFVELFLNGVHMGNYYLCEQIRVSKNRVDVTPPEPGETDAGYLFEIDSYYDETYKFRTAYRNLPLQFKDPDEVDAAQFAYMQDYINDMEASLYEDERFAAREFERYMDLRSFIDYYFVVELVQNNDACVPKSVFMHRDKGGKMVAGPVWDYDYGTFIKDPLMYLSDPAARRTGYNFMYQSSSHGHYYGRLMQDREFKKLMQERWMALRDDLATIPDFVDRTAAGIRASEAVNHDMWPIGSRNTSHDETLSFDEAVSRLKEAYTGKWQFLDGQISKWRF